MKKVPQTIWNNFHLYLKNVNQRRIETHDDGHLITYDDITEEDINANRQHFLECWKAQMSAHKALMFLGGILAEKHRDNLI